MTARILIVDAIATRRIVLKAKLPKAHYATEVCSGTADALQSLARNRPDLIVLDFSGQTPGLTEFCAGLRASETHCGTPILATGVAMTARARLAALALGADDILDQRMSDTVLTARIRSILRRRDSAAELRLRRDAERAIGFSEAPAAFAPARHRSRVSILSLRGHRNGARGASTIRRLRPEEVMRGPVSAGETDLFVIDGPHLGAESGRLLLFRLISELRAQPETRQAAILVLLPDEGVETGAMALDLGADDMVPNWVAPAEILFRARILLNRQRQLRQLREKVSSGLQAAIVDPLTGLFNRRFAVPHISALAARSCERGQPFALMAIDIDHFKAVNDRFGHAAGDVALREMAARLQDNMRSVDLVARIGGEEFLVVMPDTSEAEAMVAAERLREVIEGTEFSAPAGAPPLHLTVSVGLVMAGEKGQDPDCAGLIELADLALYRAKRDGRNMVRISRPAA